MPTSPKSIIKTQNCNKYHTKVGWINSIDSWRNFRDKQDESWYKKVD